MKNLLLTIALLTSLHIKGQKDLFIESSLSAGYSSNDSIGFWQTSEQYGAIPDRNFGMAQIYVGKNFNYKSKWDLSFGLETSAYTGLDQNILLNQYYITGRYKNWILQAGAQNTPKILGGLSSSNGNIIMSTNARAIPGFMLSTNGYIPISKKAKYTKIWLYYGEFLLNDARSTMGARLHQKGLKFQFNSSKKNQYEFGIQDYAQWGGTSPLAGKIKYSLNDYFKMVFIMPGGKNSPKWDQENIAGNHLGNYSLSYSHIGKESIHKIYISHPFEDGSGMFWQNIQDNLYGYYISFKDKSKKVNEVLVEVTNTKNMSGNWEHNQGGGQDNYFNHLNYLSGWSYHGKSIGSPFFPFTKDENHISEGIILGYNRFLAVNTGLSGSFSENISFQFKTSYVHYYGWIGEEFIKKPYNVGFNLDINIKKINKYSPIDFTIKLGSDIGNVYQSKFTFLMKLSYNLKNL